MDAFQLSLTQRMLKNDKPVGVREDDLHRSSIEEANLSFS